jgi:hypothetical protein
MNNLVIVGSNPVRPITASQLFIGSFARSDFENQDLILGKDCIKESVITNSEPVSVSGSTEFSATRRIRSRDNSDSFSSIRCLISGGSSSSDLFALRDRNTFNACGSLD